MPPRPAPLWPDCRLRLVATLVNSTSNWGTALLTFTVGVASYLLLPPLAVHGVDGYAIEGHVPAEAIVKLLATRPDAAGLALPGMPGDSPGMGGDDKSWANQKVVLVNRDGSLDAFAY